jgi:hypothetical protein
MNACELNREVKLLEPQLAELNALDEYEHTVEYGETHVTNACDRRILRELRGAGPRRLHHGLVVTWFRLLRLLRQIQGYSESSRHQG